MLPVFGWFVRSLCIRYLFVKRQPHVSGASQQQWILTSTNALFNGFGVLSAEDSFSSTDCAKSNETANR